MGLKERMMTMNYIVLDLEATCAEDKSVEHEIIEIGAVKVNEQGEVVDEFSEFVKPVQNPTLTDFCTQLTSITQEQVDDARLFPDVLASFQEWIGTEEYVLCSWGFYDKKQLIKDCERNNLATKWLNRHISVKHQYAEMKKLKRGLGVPKALEREGLTFEGIHHRGIDDARNIARIFVRYQDQFQY